jgi:hypothetical protein
LDTPELGSIAGGVFIKLRGKLRIIGQSINVVKKSSTASSEGKGVPVHRGGAEGRFIRLQAEVLP